MKLKRKILILCVSVAALTQWACTDELLVGDGFLEKPPSVDITIDTIFSNADNARGFLWNTYSSLYYGLNWDWSARGNKMNMGLKEALGDNFHSYLSWDNVNRTYYSGLYNSSQEGAHSAYDFANGEAQWTGIRQAWIFVENVDSVPDMDTAEKVRLKAEAKLIIACHYTDMFRHFGGLPLIKKAISWQEGKNLIYRSTARETVKFITDLCDEAYEVLPWQIPADDFDKWNGRLTGASALGLKIRALLFVASPLFNSDEPYYTERASEANTQLYTWIGKKDMSLWTDLEGACKEFIRRMDAEGGYSLVENPASPGKAFRAGYFNRGTTESLISTRIRETIPDNVWDGNYYFLQSATYYGSLNPTLEYVDMFPMKDGTPFDPTIWNDTLAGGINPFADRDPRLIETCLVNEVSPIQDRKAELWVGGRERGGQEGEAVVHSGGTGTGFGLFKFLITGQNLSGTEAHWPYLRLAEVYLTYAEVINELHGPTSEAFDYLNKTRRRVGLKGVKESNPSVVWDKDNFLEEVLKERACEFGAEEIRLFDMIRRKREQDFRKRLHGLDIFRYRDEDGKVVSGKYIYKKYTIAKRYLQDGTDGKVYFNPKWYLSAFPLNEVNKGYLVQNPGWE